jgi:SlyX protein
VEERLIEIEIKIANQEHLLDQLNSVIYEQQKQIDQLERAIKGFEKANTPDIRPHSEKPPHY